MLKLSIPTVFDDANYLGQVAYGVEQLSTNGDEVVSQKWSSVVSEKSKLAFTCINDGVYGSDFKDGELRVSLLRSAGYTGHPINDKPIMSQDRYSTRIDQGERLYDFWVNAGDMNERLDKIDREALLQNEKPVTLSFFPDGNGIKPIPAIILEDEVVQMTTLKMAEKSEEIIIRLFEPTGKKRVTTISIPILGLKQSVNLHGFEIKTYKLNIEGKSIIEVDLMEK